MKYCKTIVVLGEPKAQKRHRHVKMLTRDKRQYIGTYDPSKTEKANLLVVIRQNAPPQPLRVPMQVDIRFFFSRPKSHYGTGSKANILKANAPVWHTSKPDPDNLMKLVLDAMNSIFWSDDALISRSSVEKLYDERPRTEITITEL